MVAKASLVLIPLLSSAVCAFPPIQPQVDYNPQQQEGVMMRNLIPQAVSGFVTSNLRAGELGVVALTSISAAICLPITQIKSLYAISVGYGLSIATMGLVLRQTFGVTINGSLGDVMTAATIFYGIRLASYLFVREVTGWKPSVSRPQPSRWKRIPLAMSVAVFYAFMTTPVLYLLRGTAQETAAAAWMTQVSWVGVGCAWSGAILEAVGDAQKYFVKRGKNHENQTFQGPFGGVYRLTRHPNYTGEVLFWFGTWLAGVPFLGRSIVGWLCGTAGLYGIVTIMRKSTQGLEKRQGEKYSGQPDYEKWKKDVPAPLFPFIKAA